MKQRTGQPHKDRDHGPQSSDDFNAFSVTDDQRSWGLVGGAPASGARGSQILDAGEPRYGSPIVAAFEDFDRAYEAHGVEKWLKELGV